MTSRVSHGRCGISPQKFIKNKKNKMVVAWNPKCPSHEDYNIYLVITIILMRYADSARLFPWIQAGRLDNDLHVIMFGWPELVDTFWSGDLGFYKKSRDIRTIVLWLARYVRRASICIYIGLRAMGMIETCCLSHAESTLHYMWPSSTKPGQSRITNYWVN
jgi:hypothetical protein